MTCNCVNQLHPYGHYILLVKHINLFSVAKYELFQFKFINWLCEQMIISPQLCCFNVKTVKVLIVDIDSTTLEPRTTFLQQLKMYRHFSSKGTGQILMLILDILMGSSGHCRPSVRFVLYIYYILVQHCIINYCTLNFLVKITKINELYFHNHDK